MVQRRVNSRTRREAKDQALLAMTSPNHADAWNYIKRATFTAKGGDDLLPPYLSKLSTSILHLWCKALNTLNL